MARSQETSNKKDVRNRKEKKRKDKEQRRQEKKSNSKDGSFDSMIAYVDENGMITSEPPLPGFKTKINAEDIEVSVPRRQGDQVVSKTRSGIITFFNTSKGYGFIRDLENNQNVFVHINDMEEQLGENNKVLFEIERGNRGMKAVRVKLFR